MLATLKVKARERQLHYIDQIIVRRSPISVNEMVLKKEKLDVDIPRKLLEWKGDAMEGI